MAVNFPRPPSHSAMSAVRAHGKLGDAVRCITRPNSLALRLRAAYGHPSPESDKPYPIP